MGHRRLLTPEERQQRSELIAHLYTNGCTTRAITIYLALSHGLVVGILEEAGVPRRPRGRPRVAGRVIVSPVELMGADYVPPYLSEDEIGPYKARVEAYDSLYAELPGSKRSVWTHLQADRAIEETSKKRWPDPDPKDQPQISLSFDPPLVAAAPATSTAPEPTALVGTMTSATVADVISARFNQLEFENPAELAPELPNADLPEDGPPQPPQHPDESDKTDILTH